ncbi:MAG: alpha/beta hydrolase [Candidatus Lokiarchaeota archaeon]|nr:alpha/beta hydrolase [Candidatus Lokiarchaeota archaeon]
MKMPYFNNNQVKIHYEIEGKGPDLIMIHGFAANINVNWRLTNWISALKDDNRLILVDCRGHGKSDKPYDSKQYGAFMRDDIIKLMDHLSISKANLFGYSMGGSITLSILLSEPERVKSAIIGGYAPMNFKSELIKLFFEPVITGLKTENKKDIKNPAALSLRNLAESGGEDLKALIAVMEGNSSNRDQNLLFDSLDSLKSTFKKVKIPVLSVIGSDDVLISNKAIFAETMPGACHFQIQGRNHLTVVPDERFHIIVKAFLNYINKK